MVQVSYQSQTSIECPAGYKLGKLQKILMDFHRDPAPIARVEVPPEAYTNLKSASSSFRIAIKRMNLNMLVRCIRGALYLIKY